MGRYFQILTPSPQRQIIGEYILASNATTVYNGHLAALSDDGGTPTWIKANGSVAASGMFYEHMNMLEEMTDLLDLADEQLITAMAGKRVGVLAGQFRALLSVDYFNTAPAVGGSLYDAEDGTLRITTSGHELVGRCLGTQTIGGDTTVYDCWFNFGSILGTG